MMAKEKLPTIISKEQIAKLFEAVYLPKLHIAMFVSLMCGLRVQEIRNLLQADVNLQRKEILIRNSKNPNRSKEGYGKDRIVPIPVCAIDIIKSWLSIVQGHSKWFLPSDKSTEIPVSKSFLEEGFAEARKRSGLDSVEYVINYKKNARSLNTKRNQYHIKWHSLRHFYACYVYDKTRDLYAVSHLLGHNQITTTQIYAKVSNKVLKENIDFAFDIPIKTKIFDERAVSEQIRAIPEMVKGNKSPIKILEERFAKGEISDIDFANKLRLLKMREEYIKEKV